MVTETEADRVNNHNAGNHGNKQNNGRRKSDKGVKTAKMSTTALIMPAIWPESVVIA